MRVLVVLAALVPGILAAAALLDFLDLPLTNAEGELHGGVNPSLPYDQATLQEGLSAARSVGVPPKRYRALLRQYWLVRASDEAGISLRDWDPQRKPAQNRAVIFAVYDFYARLYLAHPELRWTAFANLAGSVFAAAMLDLGSLPFGGWYPSMLMSMQKHIFMDIGTMHVAYVSGGRAAIKEMREATLIDAETAAAWSDPASAVMRFSYREQNLVIAEQFDRFRAHVPWGRAITYGMAALGPMPVPGAKTPTEYRPALCGMLPDFNYADRDARWDYLSKEVVPAYLRLNASTVRQIVTKPLVERVAGYRGAHRLPEMIAQLENAGCGL
ncbi:hypothetical protein CDD83_8717 [Cordyceps sp. RAO-2017]|nr:hypothetical protein CDD83_8717 [Cordyceps sp. RAO-2017]